MARYHTASGFKSRSVDVPQNGKLVFVIFVAVPTLVVGIGQLYPGTIPLFFPWGALVALCFITPLRQEENFAVSIERTQAHLCASVRKIGSSGHGNLYFPRLLPNRIALAVQHRTFFHFDGGKHAAFLGGISEPPHSARNNEDNDKNEYLSHCHTSLELKRHTYESSYFASDLT